MLNIIITIIDNIYNQRNTSGLEMDAELHVEY